MTGQPEVTWEAINELADRIEAAGKNYHEIIDGCTDQELLRQAAMALLVRAMSKTGMEALVAAVRDEIIARRVRDIEFRDKRREAKNGG